MTRRLLPPLFRDRDRFVNDNRYLDRFGLLLVVTTLTIVVQLLVDLPILSSGFIDPLGSFVAMVLIGSTLVIAAYAAGMARLWRLVVLVLVGVSILGSGLVLTVDRVEQLPALESVPPAFALSQWQPVLWLVLAALSPAAVVARLGRHRAVTGRTVLGALAAYLLIAVAFTYAFYVAALYSTEPFFGEDVPSTAYMYFSLTTITTLGYGDLAPVGELPRLLATFEALLGQLYLVTVVALVVGFVKPRQRRDEEEAG